MTLDDLRRLAAMGEGRLLEFKNRVPAADKLAREVIALANTDGVSGTSAPCSLFGYCRTVFVDSVRITLQGKPPLPVPAARHGHAALA